MVKIIISKDILLDACQKCQKIISSKNTLPILDNIKFDIRNPKAIYLSASDLETHISTFVLADEIQMDDDISFCLAAKLLVDTISTLPNEPLTINIGKVQCEIETTNGRFLMPLLDANDFPLQRTSTSLSFEMDNVPLDEFLSVVHSVLFAVYKDTLRPALTGVNIVKSDALYFNATDTHRLTSNILDISSEGKIDIVCPIKPLQALNTLFSDRLRIAVGDFMSITDGVTTVQIQLIVEKYPNVFSVIPKRSDDDITFKAKKLELIKLLKLAILYSNKSSSMIAITVKDGEIQIEAQDLDFSISAKEEYQCKTNGEIKIGFNGDKLLDCIKNLGCDEVEFRMSTPNRAALIVDAEGMSSQKTVMMPLMIQ